MPHSIRLRGPWQLQPLGRAVLADDGPWRLLNDDLPVPGTAEAPADWGATLGGDFRGLVRYKRTFHRPTGLDERSRVWVVIENVDFQAALTLNEQPLGIVQLAGSPPTALLLESLPDSPLDSQLASPLAPSECPARFDITTLLASANHLQLDILLPPDTANIPRPNRRGHCGGLIGLVRLEIELGDLSKQ